MFVIIGQEVLMYDDPSKIMLGALKHWQKPKVNPSSVFVR